MVSPDIIKAVRAYLDALPAEGIHPAQAVIFGSHARDSAHSDSDIDVLIIAPEFDKPRPIPIKTAALLWRVCRKIDIRIEPIPCGVDEWHQPHTRPALAAAQQEGIAVAA